MSQRDNASNENNETPADTAGTPPVMSLVPNDEGYGIGILQLREIIEYANLTVVPVMPGLTSGRIRARFVNRDCCRDLL